MSIRDYGTVGSAHRQPSKIFTASNWTLGAHGLSCARYLLMPRLHDFFIINIELLLLLLIATVDTIACRGWKLIRDFSTILPRT